jgi:hypothetical protein
MRKLHQADLPDACMRVIGIRNAPQAFDCIRGRPSAILSAFHGNRSAR